MSVERRAFEIRATSAGALAGVVIPYGVPSKIGGAFSETFEAGSIRYGDRVMANRQHDRSKPLARIGHGLKLDNGAEALRAEIILPDTMDGRDVRALVDAGVLTGMSAEFLAIREEWPKPDERRILEAELRGLAVVDDPAHESALIAEVRARIATGTAPERHAREIWTWL